MAQAGLKQQLFAVPAALAKESGRYAVGGAQAQEASAEQSRDVLVSSDDARKLLEINQLSREELTWIEERTSTTKSEPVRGVTSAVFAKDGEDPKFEALRPFYREPTLERVQLQFEDRSLDPARNPLAHSSLLPAPRRALGISGILAIGVGVLALSSVGYLGGVAGWGVHRQSATVNLPARMPGVPRVVTLEPVVAEQRRNADIVSHGEDVPWSIPSVAGAPALPVPGVAPEANPSAAAPASTVVPGARRRRLAALRARMAEVRAQSAAPAIAAPTGLPAQPTREQIRSGLEGVRSAMQTCAGVQHGTSTARVIIASTGHVASATIGGAFAGTPEGSCMARALRNAVFPRFSDPNLQVTYPFRL